MSDVAEVILWILLVIQIGEIGLKAFVMRQAEPEPEPELWWWAVTMMVTTPTGEVRYRTAMGEAPTQEDAEGTMYRSIREVEELNVETYMVNTAVHRAG